MILVKIKTKTIAISLASAFFLVLLISLIFDLVIIKYIESVETSKLNNKFQVLTSVINREEEGIISTSRDWSNWDASYNFIAGIKKQDYIDANLQDNTLKQLNISFMFFTNTKGDITYSISRNLKNEEKDDLFKKITNKKRDTSPILTFKDNYENHTGTLFVAGKIYIVTTTAVTTTDGKTKSNGSIVIGKELSNSFITYADSVINGNLSFKGPLSEDGIIYNKIERTNSSAVEYMQISDITGENSIVAGITIAREEYVSSIYYMKYFIALYGAATILTVLISLLIVDKYILKRIEKISEFTDTVKETKDMKARLYIRGKDEISNVANSVNEMLNSLNSAYEDSKTAERRFQLIMESTNDGYIDYNFVTKEFYISSEYRRFFEYDKTSGTYDPSEKRVNNIHPDSTKQLKDKFDSLKYEKKDYLEYEYEIMKKTGEKVWIFQRVKITDRDENGNPARVITVLSDVTARKEYEGKLLTLSYSDKLTGLKNRAFIEKKFQELDNKIDSDYSVIIGDLNGLKLTNDTFGHHEGDRLIKKAAEVMENVCSEKDIVARWGGDEFVILVENRAYEYTLNLIKTIKEECEKINSFNYKVSIALGSARKIDQLNFETVMNMAEEKMYRSKLIEKSSSRNATIASLEKTLYEKNSETEEHTKRIKILGKKLGEKLNLPLDKLDELELLGSLHDIGKIGIPEQILTKPEELSAEEWEVMKKHTEIGYRIARATPELSHVAFEILCHHEKFDGTGYPQGLKGEEIPILSRIINVIDSFDVMTHKRVYKEAYSKGGAIEELKRCSGTQFDPLIVDELMNILLKKQETGGR